MAFAFAIFSYYIYLFFCLFFIEVVFALGIYINIYVITDLFVKMLQTRTIQFISLTVTSIGITMRRDGVT